MFTFDYSTLYTKSSYDKLLSVLHKLVDFSLDGGEHNIITISKHGTSWSKD